MEELTLAAVLTTGGAVAAAGLITGFISLLKGLPFLGNRIENGLEPLLAFTASAILVALAYVYTVTDKNIATGFTAFLAWYGVARLSMAVYDDVTQKPGSVSNLTGDK